VFAIASEFCKWFRSGRKQPDRNEVGLQNRGMSFNRLAQKPIGYRYTIPQVFINAGKALLMTAEAERAAETWSFYPLVPSLGKRRQTGTHFFWLDRSLSCAAGLGLRASIFSRRRTTSENTGNSTAAPQAAPVWLMNRQLRGRSQMRPVPLQSISNSSRLSS
jgi:hypothetical protein